ASDMTPVEFMHRRLCRQGCVLQCRMEFPQRTASDILANPDAPGRVPTSAPPLALLLSRASPKDAVRCTDRVFNCAATDLGAAATMPAAAGLGGRCRGTI